MLTITGIGLAVYICASFLHLHYANTESNKLLSKILERAIPSIAAVSIFVALFGSIFSFVVSASRADKIFDNCIPGQSTIHRGAIVTDGEAFYRVDSDNILWIPFGIPDYEPCEAPEGICTTCMTVQNTPYCEDCGNKIDHGDNACSKCGAACNSEFCGQCGTKIEIGEK